MAEANAKATFSPRGLALYERYSNPQAVPKQAMLDALPEKICDDVRGEIGKFLLPAEFDPVSVGYCVECKKLHDWSRAETVKKYCDCIPPLHVLYFGHDNPRE